MAMDGKDIIVVVGAIAAIAAAVLIVWVASDLKAGPFAESKTEEKA